MRKQIKGRINNLLAIESQQDALARTACGIPARREERED